MPNVDEYGNKIVEKELNKKVLSKNRRQKRMVSKTSPRHCQGCGYKIRGRNHIDGSHHKSGERKPQ